MLHIKRALAFVGRDPAAVVAFVGMHGKPANRAWAPAHLVGIDARRDGAGVENDAAGVCGGIACIRRIGGVQIRSTLT